MFPAAADGELVDRIATDMATAPREVALGSLRYALNRQPAILEALPHITAPIVAINPDIQPTDVDSMRRHGIEPIVLKDVGHFLMIEDPEQFNPVLAATLASFGAYGPYTGNQLVEGHLRTLAQRSVLMAVTDDLRNSRRQRRRVHPRCVSCRFRRRA